MAVSKRRGKWVADYYDAFKRRRWQTFPTKKAAEDFEAKARVTRSTQATTPTVDPDIRFSDYASRFLKSCGARGIKPRTIERYDGALRLHLVPRLGPLKVREISRPVVKGLLESKLADEAASMQGQRKAERRGKRKLARGSVRQLLTTLNAVLGEAVEDQLIAANPLRALGKKLGLRVHEKTGSVKAFDREQLAHFLREAEVTTPEEYPIFAVMAQAGLRLGEALALRPASIDLNRQQIRVTQQLRGGTKNNRERVVDMADVLRDVLSRSLAAFREAELRLGGEAHWLFFPELTATPEAKDEQRLAKRVGRRMARVLEVAGLPPHHTPHALRHTFGSLLVASGTSIAYVRDQLGHASIQMTVDVYGSWLPVSDVGALNRVFGSAPAADGSKMVAAAV